MSNDKDENLTPIPSEVKSEETQSPESKLKAQVIVTSDSGGLESHSLSQSLQQFGYSESSRYKTQFLMMAAAWVEDVSAQQRATSASLAKLEANEALLHNELLVMKVENATLKEREKVKSAYKPLTGMVIFAAPIIIGIGIDQIKSENLGTGIVLSSVGALLLIVGLYVLYGRGDSNE